MILRVETTTGLCYDVPVKNKLEAAKVLLSLQRMGILCKRWKYEKMEVVACSRNG